MLDNPQTRQWVRTLLNGQDADTGTPEPPTPAGPITGPVIPGQEQRPNLSQGPTTEQRFVNQMFSGGTAREYL